MSNGVTGALGGASGIISLAETGFSFVMGMLAAHDKRVKLARTENAAVAQCIAALDHDLATIFDALNKGDMTESVAIAACADIEKWYWQYITPYTQNQNVTEAMCNSIGTGNPVPGTVNTWGAPDGNPVGCGSTLGGKTCTSACCIGCAVIVPSLRNAAIAAQKHGGTILVGGVGANKYGLAARPAYKLTYKKPKVVNPEAEVTLSKTGVLTIGAAPSNQDVVVAQGVIATNAPPDSGGDVIPHTAAGTDVTTALSNPPVSGIAGIPLSWLLAGGIAVAVIVIAGGSK
jgi:hypothetical protein